MRQHFATNIAQRYAGLDVTFDSFPVDTVASDPNAFVAALESMAPGDVCIIFTPDDTHYTIALEALQRRLHVLVTKPMVMTRQAHVCMCRY